ncbi:MAG: SDR family oxidoreductase [Pseudomonadota bacterium]
MTVADTLAGRLSGKTALITGASAGIGRAIAVALAREGAAIVATGRRVAELESLERECQAFGGKLRFVAGDLDSSGFAAELAASAGDVDIFVNNAGVLTYAPFIELTDEQNAAMFQVNVLASIRISQLVAKGMAARKNGHIVMMTSLSARNIGRFSAVYGATKHAMAGITKGLRLELGPLGLKVTEIAPGMVDTDIRKANTHAEALKAVATRTYTPLSAEDVAQAVLYAVCTPPNCCPDLIELRPTYA